jgi:hypothetical protein
MTQTDKSRRQRLALRLKSAITTAAIVGTLAGWGVFGVQQLAATNVAVEATSVSAPAAAQVVASIATAAPTSTTSQSTTLVQSSAAQSSTSSSSTTTRSRAITTTRSSR